MIRSQNLTMKPATIIRPGMSADNVLKLRGRSAQWAVAPPSMEGHDDEGFIIAWHYIDCDVILSRWNGCYRVKEVRDVQPTNA